jgi:phosphate transport system substrate-binding protein
MKHIRSVLATLLAALSIAVMAAPATAACPPDLAGRLRLHGSNTIGAELAPALAAAFAACEGLTDQSVNQLSDPDEREFIFGGGDSERKLMFEDFAHGSSTAPPDLAAQPAKADIGMMSRLPTDAEIAELVGAGRGRPLPPPQTDPNAPPSDAGYEHVIALDGIAVFVNKRQTPISQMPICQIAQIFAGRFADWSELHGIPGPIQIYARDARSGTWDTFNELVLKPCGVTLSSQAKRYESNLKLSQDVEGDPGGIGFTSLAFVGNNKSLFVSTTCPILTEASPFMAKTEEYPISRRLFMFAPPSLSTPLRTAFLDYVRSDDAQPVVESSGFVNFEIIGGGAAYTASRIAQASHPASEESELTELRFARLIAHAERLSVTIRFRVGSSALDARAIDDIDRIARLAQSPRFAGHQIILAGFADSRGSWETNLALTYDRARAVAAMLADKHVPNVRVEGFSYAEPVACNNGSPDGWNRNPEWGLQMNRRVEVWVTPPLTR